MSLRLPILFLALITVASISCKQRSSDAVTGIIQVVIDQEVRPIAQAQIRLIPKAPTDGAKRVDEQPEDPVNLRGVDTTNDTGVFEILALSSDQTFQEYGLLRNWTYELQIQVPGYYLFTGEVAYADGGRAVQVELRQKGNGVDDDTGGVEVVIDGLAMGSVRRGK
jgi:hypothetical protein